ncbi:MAG: histone deacetylase superfamily, partial [Thermomicrobiales bacterium]|nr:histone deacetylase superfamily [Thermomicrobiales bacterium]
APNHHRQSRDRPAATAARPTALLRSPRFLGHDTGAHPENAGRMRAIEAALAEADLLHDRPDVPFGPATREQLARIHTPSYVNQVEAMATSGGGWLDGDTVVREDSFAIASLAAGAAVAAVDAVLDGTISRAFVLARPPGHHATPSRGMGFCLLNGIAIAAAQALTRGTRRVLILDWDVHHGNGTQDTFYLTNRVLFCSIHQSPLYPGTGATTERGQGNGTGYTLNVPLPPGLGDEAYQQAMTEIVLPAARAFAPDLVLVSAGFDAHRDDPLANMTVTEDGFAFLASAAVQLANESADGRLVAILEGGYDPDALGRSVAAVVTTFDAAVLPERLVQTKTGEPNE